MVNALYYLNTSAVRQAIRAQALKHWWVAEQAGVHPTTMRRWLSRKIYQVRAKHIIRLAAVLGVAPQEIVFVLPTVEQVKGNIFLGLPCLNLSA